MTRPPLSNEPLKVRIGLRVKELRALNKITQEELSLRSGIYRTYITEIESGKRNPSASNIQKLAAGLDMSVAAFFESDLFTSVEPRTTPW